MWVTRRLCTLLASALLPTLVGSWLLWKKVDWERFAGDRERLEKLEAAPLTGPGARAPGEWPQWRGPNRDGLSTETGLDLSWPRAGPPLLWQKQMGRGFSSVVVAGGRVYGMAQETAADSAAPAEAVLCLDAETGREIWRFRYPNQFNERFGAGPRSTPAVDGGLVYAVGPTGIFHCLRADTGAKVWRHDLLQEFHGQPMQYGVSFSPLVDGDLVFVCPGGPGASVAAFNKHTGALAWKALDDTPGYSSPVAATIAGVHQVLFLTNTELVGLAPSSGAVLWRFPWETSGGFNIATPVVIGNYVFLSSAYGKGCALVEVTAGPDSTLHAGRVYEHNRMRNYFASSVRQGDYLYGLDNRDLVCMEVRTGKVVWREAGQFNKGTLLIADGHLIVLAEDGTLHVAEATPAGYREKAVFQVTTNKCWTVPTVAAGRLFVRDEARLFCFGLRKKS